LTLLPVLDEQASVFVDADGIVRVVNAGGREARER